MSGSRDDAEEQALLDEVRAHDTALRARGVELWIGAEPTFTLRESQDPEWLVQAEGSRKLEKGVELLQTIVAELRVPARFVRAQGRQFPGESQPRFCLGAEWVRGSSGPPVSPASVLLDGPLEPVPRPHPERAWLTITPDPAVLEVNLPPCPDLESFLALTESTFRAAAAVGLSAERFRFNGEATDSGGGGQITLGGPSPEASPFFAHPWLLPAVLRFLQIHPSLSYAFAGECVGSASQGPRPDEGVRERFEELAVSLDRLESRGKSVTHGELWGSLAPLLVDASGNTHRAEVNVEKLWNPGLGPRGLAGLVEFRSLRMPRSAGQLVGLAALFRSICARLVTSPGVGPLREWGTALHERWALPFFLEQDLRAVLEDLSEHQLGLGPVLSAALLERTPPLWTSRARGAVLEIREALEFWPLLGDVASQEALPARLVDPSTRRDPFDPRAGHAARSGRGLGLGSTARAGRAQPPPRGAGGGRPLPRIHALSGAPPGARSTRSTGAGLGAARDRQCDPAPRLESRRRCLPGSAIRCGGGEGTPRAPRGAHRNSGEPDEATARTHSGTSPAGPPATARRVSCGNPTPVHSTLTGT